MKGELTDYEVNTKRTPQPDMGSVRIAPHKNPTLAELVDAADLKSASLKRVRVRVSKVGP